MSDEVSVGALVACMVISTAGRSGGTKYNGTASTLAEDIEQRFGVTVSLDRVSKSAKLMEDAGVTVVSRDPNDDPWIAVDFRHFNRIFAARKQSNAKRSEVALFDRFHTLRSYGEFGNDWLDHVVATRKNQGLVDFRGPDGEALDVPASDRVVSLTHNQVSILDASASDLVDLVDRENSIEGDSDRRNIILGQLKAGRELIRAQTFRAYLLYQTLLTALGMLIDKYGKTAIGVAATKLLELLIEQVFKK